MQHPSAESDIEPDDYIGIQGMSLGPSGAAHLRDWVGRVKTGPLSAAVRASFREIASVLFKDTCSPTSTRPWNGSNKNDKSKPVEISTQVRESKMKENYVFQISRWDRLDCISVDLIHTILKISIPTTRGRRINGVRL